MAEPYTRGVTVPAELVDALRALADEMEDPNAERGTMPGVRMHVRRVWAARLRTVLGAFAARALVDAAERPTAGEGETTRWIDGDYARGFRDGAEEALLSAADDIDAQDQRGTWYENWLRRRAAEYRPAAPVGEPLCKCGHRHPYEPGGTYTSQGAACEKYWVGCPCTAFTPAPLSPSVRRTRDEAITLTDEEREAIRVAWRGPWSDEMVPNPPERMVAAVESILAARLAGEDDR